MGCTASTKPQCLYSTAIPLLPLWAVQPAQSLSACTRVTFTLNYLQFSYQMRKGEELYCLLGVRCREGTCNGGIYRCHIHLYPKDRSRRFILNAGNKAREDYTATQQNLNLQL